MASPEKGGLFEVFPVNDKLAKREEEFQRFFTLSLDMLCIASLDGYFKQLNPAFEALGYELAELLQRPFLDFVHPDDYGRTVAEMEKLAKGEPTIRFENRYRCKDGSYRWLSWVAAPTPSGTVHAVARDVTEDKKSAQALIEAKEVAEAASRELEAFSYSVSHDLRAPLRRIDGFSAALLEDCGEALQSQGQTYLARIRENIQLMAELIDDLLALSRVTRTPILRRSVDLSALAESVAAALQRTDPTRSVSFEIREGMSADGDHRLLRVALENLIGNAWKFTSKCAAARVEVGVRETNGEIVFFVSDNGVGFDMQHANKLFVPFQRLHSTRDFQGNGIGLATVQRVIHRHAGRVWAEGRTGEGATFYFTLSGAKASRPSCAA